MNIVVCGDCFWIGHDTDVANIKIEEGGPLHKIIISNDLVLQLCPKCGGSKILRKVSPGNNDVQLPGVWVNNNVDSDSNVTSNIEEDESNDIVSDLLDSAEKTSEKLVRTPRRPAPRYGEYECVDCGSKFQSKGESSRCDDCNVKFMKQYVQ